MYGTQTQPTEKTALAVGICLKNLIKKETLIPSNKAEIIIPLDQDLEIKMVGTFRSIQLEKQLAYFLKPRGRGMEIFGNASYLLIQIHPGYTKFITKWLNEHANGIYNIEIKNCQVDDLIHASNTGDLYQVNDSLDDSLQIAYEEPNHFIKEAIELINGSCGSTTIKEIYTHLDISKSTLEQRFNKDVGLTPKEFCKIEKLNCFIKTYKESGGASLTELTYQCGYYDQSHLIKDFRYFLDMSPREYFH